MVVNGAVVFVQILAKVYVMILRKIAQIHYQDTVKIISTVLVTFSLFYIKFIKKPAYLKYNFVLPL